MNRPAVQQALEKLQSDVTLQPITNPPFKLIKSINFGILSPKEILDLSVCEITSSKISIPHANTVYDERMGPYDSKGICATCGLGILYCPGHFGHIVLQHPIIHPQYAKYLASILNTICPNCSHIRLTLEHLSLETFRTLKEIEALCKSVPLCFHCSHPCPDIILEEAQLYKVFTEKKVKKKSLLTIQELETILTKVSEETLKLIGIKVHQRICKTNGGLTEEVLSSFRPEWLILKILPVLPPISRPPNYENGEKKDDDLTLSYIEIIKCNQKLTTTTTEKNRNDILKSLDMYVRSFIDNSRGEYKHTSGKPIKSIKDRISKKEGQIRGNNMGKRVDYSARTVITADPTLKLNEVGVPECLAKILSFPENVLGSNIEKLSQMLMDGQISMIKREGKLFVWSVSKLSKNPIQLRIGDQVYRDLHDGDVVIFNRQPTLHRGGMMAHSVKVLPAKTFRLNLSVTKPYNADFDGDEMQLHVPQDYETVVEVEEIMGINKMIVASQANKPIMGIIQDALIGSYLLTHDVILKKHQFMDCVLSAGKEYISKLSKVWEKCEEQKIPILSGKALFSILLPDDFYYLSTNKELEIVNGILIRGIVDSKIIGSAYGSIIHRLYKEYSPDVSAQFITALQYLINRYLIFRGFSVGLKDLIISEENQQGVKESIQKAYIEVDNIERSNDPQKIKEFKINSALNHRGQKVAISGLCKNNRLETMIKCGSKGSIMNIIQISGHLGQNNVEGKRMMFELDDESRTLYCFERGDIHPKTRGFIENCFLYGLSPTEFFFHAKAGREGCINTSVKTRESGYSERKLVKRMEDLVVEQDYTVRNSVGNIIQFAYGSDNYDAIGILNNSEQFIDIDAVVQKLNLSVKSAKKKDEWAFFKKVKKMKN